MTKARRAELDRYYAGMLGGGVPPTGITPPTADEERQYRAVSAPQSGITSADREGSATGRTAQRSASSTPSAGGAPVPSANGTTRRVRGSQPTSPVSDQATPARERSSWSEFLHQAMAESGPEGLRIPFEQHPSGIFDRYQNVAQPGFGRPAPNLMPGQQPAPSQRGPMRLETGTTPVAPQFRPGPPPGPGGTPFPPRYQNLSPTLAPDSRTMTNFSGAMQRVQPMMGPQRPMQPSFPSRAMPTAMPTTDTRFMASDRSYTPPPSYRQPRSAEELMAEMELMRGR